MEKETDNTDVTISALVNKPCKKAHASGLLAGDVITHVDDEHVDCGEDALRLLPKLKVSGTVVNVTRAGKRMRIKID